MSDQKALLKRALDAIEDLEIRLRRAESRAREPIAVVGMSCRFPGANGPVEMWELLHNGIDAVRAFPEERWAWTAAGPPRPGIAGGFIDGLDQFDPAFFGISPREAATMDPQQRLFLEGVWHALEDAGVRPPDLVNSNTGVFVGITTSDYGQLTRASGHDVYVATGAALNAVSGRTSFVLGLQGPCIAMDTACSSSLVAVHTACQSLRAGDCDLALAGGVNALISPEPFELFGRWGMIAPDGRCKTFDAAADGFSRGEGCGVLVLKRLSAALADHDRILALIRGSAVNQDGRSSGLSVPNGPAQQKVLRTALHNAGLAPLDVDYVEAHGTGTVLGDPIEVEAIAAVYGQGRSRAEPLRIGSVKSNIAHCESASGVAGLCKVILALEHQEIPPHLHFHEPNPRIAWDEYPLEVNVTPLPWPRGERPRRAGVSSFGFTGTNSHVVLEEAPQVPGRAGMSAPAYLLPVSARSANALQQQARVYAAALAPRPHTLPAFARAAGTERTHFPMRRAIVARDGNEAAVELRRVHSPGPVTRDAAPLVAFLFSGQGAQRSGMGRELYESAPLAREVLDRCAAICAGKLPVPLLDALFGTDPAVLRHTAVTQPALFALEYALAKLWESWGVRPVAVLGHSLGEYVAACVAGALTLEAALDLVIERGRLMGELPAGGTMAAVFASHARVQAFLDRDSAQISLAGVNGPDSTTISGTADAVSRAIAAFATEGIEARPLDVSHAFHSPLMDPILERLHAAASRVQWQPAVIPIASNLYGRLIAPGETLDAGYWRRHAREPVQFMDGMNALRSAGCNTFIEIGPASTLLGLGRRMLPDPALHWLPSFAAEGEWRTLMHSAGAMWEQGLELDWNTLGEPYAPQTMRIPGYAFDRRRHWIDVSRLHAAAPPAGAHPLLGAPVELAGDEVRAWTGTFDLERLPWLADHCVQGSVIVPATAYVELAFAAAVTVLGDGPVRMLDVVNEKPLLLAEHQRFTVQTRLTQEVGGTWRFEVHSRRADRQADRWTRHVSARLERLEAEPERTLDPAALRERCAEHVDGPGFYARLGAKGNQWGPAFQAVAEVWRGGDEAIARVVPPASIRNDLGAYRFHPAFSDGAGHVLVATGELDRSNAATGGALVGGGIAEIRQYVTPMEGDLWAHAVRRVGGGVADNVVAGDVCIYDTAGRLVSETRGARLWYLREDGSRTDDIFYELAWQRSGPAEVGSLRGAPRTWLVLQDGAGIAAGLAARLRSPACRVTLVEAGDLSAALDAVPDDTALGVVDLTTVGRDGSPADVLAALTRLVQRLGMRSGSSRLWLATSGAHRVLDIDRVSSPVGAAVWGFARALAVEHRELWGGLVDLDSNAPSTESALTLWQCVQGMVSEAASAYRAGQSYVPRLRRARPPRLGAPLRFEGTAMISGGLGGIGLEVARWLVENGCRSLVLLGRNVPGRDAAAPRWTTASARIAALEAAGARVRVEAVDVADMAQVLGLAERLKAADLEVASIFHAAGTLQYGPVAQLSTDALTAVLAPKVNGARNLLEVFRAHLGRVVFFSSTSALLPSPLMAGYAAANAYLDALAAEQRGQGLAATSINWGTWGDVGMATHFAERDSGAVLTGLSVLSTEEALAALTRALQADVAQLGVMRMDWAEWQRLYPEFIRDPLFTEFATPEGAAPSNELDVARLAALDPDLRRDALADYVAAAIGRILGVASTELDRSTSITQLGFDSLMALETKNRIESDLGLLIPVVRLLDGPSVDQLAGDLSGIWNRRAESTPAALELATALEGEI